ncbi:DnaD domain protein [Ruminococcus difficilis]|uniref:DnaD domain protein n=1 Tax=Ruminococcus difficilis TaxID=2763069 RepID=A0A934TZQ6_9FIRM|nr:DnaD domain protein [Ruminococcus difficilis]MBK6087868.1 DnaD domain protein [Ruminococcus difficilis]
MSIQINLGQWKSVFAVPSSVVDQHIKIASESQLKVLLYLLRHSDENNSAEQIGDTLRLSAEEVQNAVDFWIERDLLTQQNDGLAPASAPQSQPAVTTTQPVFAEEVPKKPRTTISRAQRPDPIFVSKLLQENTILAELLDEVQRILNKPLSPGDTATIVMLYDSFGLPCDVILMLLTYLDSIGSANMRAIERYGIQWADKGIKTVDEAGQETARMKASREAWGSVSKLLGIRNVGNPTKAQMENADRWLNTWQFSDEMITEAYERCVNTKGTYNISYINAILKRWYEKGIKSIDTLQKEESAKQRKPKSKPKSGKGSVFSVEGASFDVKKYEDTSLFDD